MRYNLEHTLIIYGSLAPMAANHYVVEHISGQWLTATVRGCLENMGWGADLGYLGFRQTDPNNAQNIAVHLLISEQLTQNWAYLDDFEGDGYQRTTCPYTLPNGDTGVGYIYAIND